MLDKFFAGLRHQAPIVVAVVLLAAVFALVGCLPTPKTSALGGAPLDAVSFNSAVIVLERDLENAAAEAQRKVADANLDVQRVNAAIVAKDRLVEAGRADLQAQAEARQSLIAAVYDSVLPMAQSAGALVGVPPETSQFILGGLFSLLSGTPFAVWASKRSFAAGQTKK